MCNVLLKEMVERCRAFISEGKAPAVRTLRDTMLVRSQEGPVEEYALPGPLELRWAHVPSAGKSPVNQVVFLHPRHQICKKAEPLN